MSDKAKFRREIYCLEFSFKPLRMIEVDVPLAGGDDRAQAGLVHGLPHPQHGPSTQAGRRQGRRLLDRNRPRAAPFSFCRSSFWNRKIARPTGGRVSKSYLDRVIPAADAAISQRETPGHTLLNSVEISKQPIPVSDGRIDRSVWGVATWVDVDPRIDFFSIYVGGLTNAYRWTDTPAAYHAGDAPGRGRQFVHKMLQLNFWRPGDELMPNEREFRYGVPLDKADLYSVGDGVAYRWVYR